MEPLSTTPSPRWGNWLNGAHIVRFLELVQDLIVISLCIGLFGFMVMQLREMFLSLTFGYPLDAKGLASYSRSSS